MSVIQPPPPGNMPHRHEDGVFTQLAMFTCAASVARSLAVTLSLAYQPSYRAVPPQTG